jgi:hypothetical protein
MHKGQEKGSGQPAINRSKQGGYEYKGHCRFTDQFGSRFSRCCGGPAGDKEDPRNWGFLPNSPSVYAPYVDAFRQGLRDLGYSPGQNILLEHRYVEGKEEQLPEVADELVRLKVDILVVSGGTLAVAKQATNTIPIVVATAGDLVGDGYVASLARPGGNRID